MTISLTPGLALDELKSGGWIVSARNRAYWRLADENGPDFIEGVDGNGAHIVPQYPLESPNRWNTRKSRAKAPSLVRHIVDHYTAHVFRAPVGRTGTDERADEILADADGYGTPLHRLLRTRCRQALVERHSYILCDTNAERFILREVSPDAVLAAVVAPGGVAEAVMLLVDPEGRPFLWHVTATEQRKAILNKDATAIVSVEPWESHSFGACPLVAVCGMPSFVPPVSDSQKRLAVLDSLLQCELHASAFSQPVFTGVEPKAMEEVIRSNAFVLCFPDPNAKAFMLGSDPAQAVSISTERDKEMINAYREAKVSPVQATPGAPESGVARAYRFVDADVELAGIAESIETAERALWQRLAAAGACVEPTVTYPRSFIPVDDAGELNELLAVWSSNLPNTLRRAAVERYAEAVGLSDDDLEALQAELDGMFPPAEETAPTTDPGT